MRAGLVAARDERRCLGLDRLQRGLDVLALRRRPDRSSGRSGRSRCTSRRSASRRSRRRRISPPAALACTNTTSASPRRPVSSAWPVPCAITFTSMPVLALKIGRMWPNRPESCVEVVEATTMDLSCAERGRAERGGERRARARIRRFMHVLHLQITRSPRRNAAASGVAGEAKNARGLGALDQPAARQKHDVAGEPARLPEVVRRHHDLHARGRDVAHDVLHGFGGGRIEARGRLVEKQHLGIARERAGEREPLLLAAGEPRAGRSASARKADAAPAVRATRRVVARRAAHRRRSPPRSGAASPAAGTPWRAARPASPRPPHVTRPAVGAHQAHREAQQRALARAVRAEQHGRRAWRERRG